MTHRVWVRGVVEETVVVVVVEERTTYFDQDERTIGLCWNRLYQYDVSVTTEKSAGWKTIESNEGLLPHVLRDGGLFRRTV